MPHYDAGQWSDFVRGLIAGPKVAAMETHANECEACRRTAELLRHVALAARVDPIVEPPEHLVRWARALYTSEAPGAAAPPRRSLARLVFDSFAAPAPAGVRAQGRVSRHLLYESGAFGLDLRLEYERGSPRVTLVGQVLDRERPERPLSGVSIQIVRGRREVARTECNRFGEFQVEYEPDGRMRLNLIEERRRRRVEVSLSGFESARPGPGTAEPA